MRRQPFIETRDGVRFQPLAPVWADIRIYDIAHALSNQCRFSGHVRTHYSVAEHCVRVSELIEQTGYGVCEQLWGLLHDASEAYLVDLPTPLKKHPVLGPAYRSAERRLMKAVCRRFGLPLKEPQYVRWADAKLLATEARDLMAYHPAHWKKLTQTALAERIRPWAPETARHEFLKRFVEVGGTER